VYNYNGAPSLSNQPPTSLPIVFKIRMLSS
jgi:hypothetical protein